MVVCIDDVVVAIIGKEKEKEKLAFVLILRKKKVKKF